MANPRPISPVGGMDIAESARQQDAERRQREAQDHFDRTGERLPVYSEYDPLVPISGYEPPNIADDGDTYDNLGRARRRRDPSEMSPSEVIDSMYGEGYTDHMSHQRQLREQALKSEEDRDRKEWEAKEAERKRLREEAKSKFNNATAGLEIADDEE